MVLLSATAEAHSRFRQEPTANLQASGESLPQVAGHRMPIRVPTRSSSSSTNRRALSILSVNSGCNLTQARSSIHQQSIRHAQSIHPLHVVHELCHTDAVAAEIRERAVEKLGRRAGALCGEMRKDDW